MSGPLEIPSQFHLYLTWPITFQNMPTTPGSTFKAQIKKSGEFEPKYVTNGKRVKWLPISYNGRFQLKKGLYHNTRKKVPLPPEYRWILSIYSELYRGKIVQTTLMIIHSRPIMINSFLFWMFTHVYPNVRIDIFLRSFDDMEISLPLYTIQNLRIIYIGEYETRISSTKQLVVYEHCNSILTPWFACAFQLNPYFSWPIFENNLKPVDIREEKDLYVIKKQSHRHPLVRGRILSISNPDGIAEEDEQLTVYIPFEIQKAWFQNVDNIPWYDADYLDLFRKGKARFALKQTIVTDMTREELVFKFDQKIIPPRIEMQKEILSTSSRITQLPKSTVPEPIPAVAQASSSTAETKICSICLDSILIDNFRFLDCRHPFCYPCIRHIFITSHKPGILICPSCRKESVHAKPEDIGIIFWT